MHSEGGVWGSVWEQAVQDLGCGGIITVCHGRWGRKQSKVKSMKSLRSAAGLYLNYSEALRLKEAVPREKTQQEHVGCSQNYGPPFGSRLFYCT